MEENELFAPPEGLPIQSLDESKLTPVKNPFANYNPSYGRGGGSQIDNILGDLQKQLNTRTMDDMMQPIAYNPEESNRDRYTQSDYFSELGFDPFRNNEELYGQRQTRMNKLANAFVGMGSLAYDQFVEQATSWGDTFNVMGDMAGLDFSLKDAFQAAEMEEISKRQNELFNANPIFETQEDREGIWNFNTLANTLQQGGYAIGAIVEVAAEELAMTQLTALTFGAAGEIQALRTAKLAASIGKVAKRTAELHEAAAKASTLRKIWNGVTAAGEFAAKNVLPLGNTVDFAKGYKTLSRVDDIAYGGTKAAVRTTARGFGAFYRDVRELNLAISEAKAEAAGTYTDMQTKLEEKFKNENGREPDDLEKESLKEEALRAAQTNGAINTYLILLSNKIAFGSILKGFGPLRYMLDDDIAKGLVMLGEKDAAKVGKKFIEAADNRWLAFKHTLLKNPVKYVEANLAEALQENAQDMSNIAVQDWYLNKQKGNELQGAFDSFAKAASEQFTVQGAKTFISGFLTGSILGAGSKLFEQAGNIGEYVSDRAGYDQRRADEAARTKSVKDNLNAIYENPMAFGFNPREGVMMQANFSSLLKQAAADKDKKFFHDIQDDAMRHMILSGINTGTLDVLTGRMKDYIKNLTPEEFTQAFGVEYTKENHESMLEQAKRFEKKAEDVSKIYNKLQTDFVNPFNPAQFEANSPEFVEEALHYQSFREALNQMAFMQDTYQSAIVRQQQVLDGLKTKPGFENLPFTSLFTLTSYNQLEGEMALLEKEMENLAPELKAEKEAKLKKLKNYQSALDKYLTKVDAIQADKTLSPQESEKKMAEAIDQFRKQGNPFFLEYVNEELKKSNKNPVQASVAAEAFDNLVDYFQLQGDHEAVLEHINLLADPENFAKYKDRHMEEYRKLVLDALKKKAEEEDAKKKEKDEKDPQKEDLDGTLKRPGTQPQTNVDDEFDDDKPVFGQTFFFKTIGLHFLRDDKTVNKENGSNRFFRFTERMKFEQETYFLMPVTAANDEFGIRRADMYEDDIKLVLVKQVGDGFVYVDQEGNQLDNPTKDTIVYTSMVGNSKLFGSDPDVAIAEVQKAFALPEDMTREQVLGAIAAYKAEREEIKKAIEAGDKIALPVTGRSRGTVRLAPKDAVTGMPQEIPLQGSIIDPATDDFLNMSHPNGEEIALSIVTVENTVGTGNMTPGRMIARGKKTGNVFPIKSRKIAEQDINNIKEAVKALTQLMGKSKLSPEQTQQKKDIVNYLSGVLFWASPKKGETPAANQMWISRGQLHRGDKSWKFDSASIEKNAADIFGGLYYSVNNSMLNKKGGFFAVTMKEGKAERQTFPNYNAFLMSNEGGRTPILYTNVVPYNPDANSDDFQIEGRYLLYNTSDEPVRSKIPAPGEKDTLLKPKPTVGGIKQEDGKLAEAVKPAENPSSPAPKKGFGKSFGTTAPATEQTTETAATFTPTTPFGTPAGQQTTTSTASTAPKKGFGRNFGASAPVTPAETVTNAQSAQSSTPPVAAKEAADTGSLDPAIVAMLLANDIANTEGASPHQNEMYRLAVNGLDVKREDLTAVQIFLKRVLPQVPLHIVGNLIHNKAYGAFIRGAIHLYENAEEGTGFHEAFEAVWNSYLSASEQAQLAKEFSNRTGEFTNPFTGETKKFSEANMYDVREMLAEEFREYIMNGTLPKTAPKAKSFFQKLLDFIKSILGMSTEDRAQMDSLVNKLFVKINEGGFVNAVPVRDLQNLDAVYRAIPGTTQEVTTYAVEGVTSYFFMNLYKEGKNTDALIKVDVENNKELKRLFNAALEDMKQAIDIQFDAQFNIMLKAYEANIKRNATEQEKKDLFDKVFVPNNRLYNQLEAIRQQPMELYQLFKDSMARFGVGFSDMTEELDVMPDETEADGLGITDAIKIDPRKFGSTNFKLLLGSLTDDIWNTKEKRYEYKMNLLGLPKLANFQRIYGILLNELSGSMSRIEDGKFVSGIDEMFSRLDTRFRKKNGVYKEGFEWIQRMKVRLKYINPRTGEKIALKDLTADDVRLRTAFEASLTTMQNDPIKMTFGADGLIFNDASLDTASQNNIRAIWLNDAKATAQEFGKKDPDAIWGISDAGTITFDTKSAEYQYVMAAQSAEEILEALAILGFNFSASNKTLSLYETEIEEAFNPIRALIKDGTIGTIDQLYGKSIVNKRIDTLLTVEIFTTPEENVLVHKNAEGENQYTITQPSTISYLLNSLKSAKTLADFVRSNPQFGTVDSNGVVQLHAYSSRSVLLKPGGMLFDKKGKKRKGADIKYHLISGVAQSDGNGKNTDVLTYPDRVMQEINHLLGNVHYTIINSDKSTEFGLGLEESLVSFDDANIFVSSNNVVRLYLDQLSDELDAAIEEHNNPTNIQYYSAEVKKLAHFRDILGPKFAAQIKKAVETGKKSELLSSPEVVAAIEEYLEAEIERTKEALIEMDMIFSYEQNILEGGGTLYGSYAINNDLLAKYGLDGVNGMTEAEMNHLIAFLVINKEVAVAEQHKLIYGHPALYKDLAKRSNGANSTKAAFIDNIEVRDWMDTKMARLDGKVRANEQHATFNVISFQDNTVVAANMIEHIEEMYKSMMALQKDKSIVEERIGAEFTAEGKFKTLKKDNKGKNYGDAAKYLDVNEVDAQAWIMPDMYRDLLYMSSRLTHEQEAQWEYEKAYEIVARSSKPTDHVAYQEYHPDVITAANAVLAKGDPGAILQVLKPQYFGYNARSPIMHTVFLKNSTQPKFYRHIENTAFEKVYLTAQENQIDIIGFESGEKVGNILNSQGEMTPIYDANGQVNIPTDEEGNLSLPDIPVQNLLSRYLGIQQETPNVFKDAVVRGTQVTKLVMANFKYRGKYTSPKAEELLTEYNDILSQMVNLGKDKLMKELGVTQDAAGNYKVKDVSKMVKLLKQEAKSRDLPDNIVDAIDTIELPTGKDFRYPLDALPNRDKIDNILNSVVNSRVISEKMNGKPSVQVASSLFESKDRTFVYLKDGIWTSTKGVKIEELSDDERVSVRMTSNDLNFYRMENGKISNMEVYLPNFLEGVNLPGLRNGIIDVKSIKDKRILEALGFRIPTQGMNSIESITIKGFLPKSMGDMVVVPSEITGKSGSDFDIDKLQIYLANFYVGKNGQATYYEWKGTQEATRAHYEKIYDQGDFMSEADQKNLDLYISQLLTYNNQETVTILEGDKMRHFIYTKLDMEVVTKEFLLEMLDYNARKRAVVNAAVKKAMQNRYREVMQELVTLPENMRQLITPNSTDTLKRMANEINELKGINDLTSSSKYAIYRSLIDSSDIRHRFLSGKKLVGIAALQITSQVMAQLGETKLTGTYDSSSLYYIVNGEIKNRLVKINLNHNVDEDGSELYLDALTTADGMLISDLINEALSGFVDAAKDPFVFSLNITLDTAATWFYLQKLGVPIDSLSYFFNQPVLDKLFKERAKNRSIFKKMADDKLSNMLIAYKMSSPYYFRMYDLDPATNKSLYVQYLTAKERADYDTMRAIKAKFATMIEKARTAASKRISSPDELREAIKNMNTPGYEMTAEDAELQLAVMADYLEYSEQASNMTDFIGGIGYDNTKTKSIAENVMQVSRWKKVKSKGFIANPDELMNNTFMGTLKDQKDGIFDLFTPFFISLDYRARKAFEPVTKLLYSGAFITRDDQETLVMSYHNFVINYIMQTTPITDDAGNTTSIGAHAERLLFGDKSMASRLKQFKDSKDKNILNNMFLKELLQVLPTEKGQPSLIKMLKRVSDTFSANMILNSAKDLYQYAVNSGNTELEGFIKDLAYLTMIQGGDKVSAFNFVRLLPVEIYSNTAKLVVDAFKNNPDIQLNAAEIWKQFHQNNYKNEVIVPHAKFYKKKNGFLQVGLDMDTAKRPYVKVVTKNKVSPEVEEELRRNRLFDKLYTYTIYERFKEDEENAFFRPINKKGKEREFTEVSKNSLKPSLVPGNNGAREDLYPDNRENVGKEMIAPTNFMFAFEESDTAKILSGKKTTTVRSRDEFTRFGVAEGESKIVSINGKNFRFTNRGLLSIQEAGGVEAMATSEGLPTVQEGKNKYIIPGPNGVTYYSIFQSTQSWFKGSGKIFVYDIEPLSDGEGTTTTEPEDNNGSVPAWVYETSFTTEDEFVNYEEFEYLNPTEEPKAAQQSDDFKLADSLPPIEQNFTDGQGGRKMQPQFAGKSTMDLILSGDRTRTTRAKTDIARMIKDYGLTKIEDLVGKVIRMTDKSGRVAYTKITSINQFTQEYQDATWQKEGWEKSVTDKHVGDYPYAIEFELYKAVPVEAQSAIPAEYTNHSGGAVGADSAWDAEGKKVGVVNHNHYYFGNKTPKGNVLLTEEQLQEGVAEMRKAAEVLGKNPQKAETINLLARNWFQVKNSEQIVAIAPISDDMKTVEGGTGWAVAMGQANDREIHVFNQKDNQWYTWNGEVFTVSDVPVLKKNFAGIGTRDLTPQGLQAIRDVYAKTFAQSAVAQKSAEGLVKEIVPDMDFDPFGDDLSVTTTEAPSAPAQPKATAKGDKKYELFPGVFANPGQQQAIDKMGEFLDSDEELFLLKGRGGTGKTTIINKVVTGSDIPKANIVGAVSSHRAKGILQKSMKGVDTVTIASLLGLRQEYDNAGNEYFRERTADEEDAFRRAGFSDPIESALLIIIDEASQIGDLVYKTIMSKKRSGAKVIFMGDNAQTPPIDAETGDSPVWNLLETDNYSELTERMRQGEESPILPVTDVYANNIEKIQNNEAGIQMNPLTDRTTKLVNGEGVVFTDDRAAMIQEYVKDFQNKDFTYGTVAVAARRQEGTDFSNEVRKVMFGDKAESPYTPGDFIRVNSPHRGRYGELIFENGMEGTVKSVKEMDSANRMFKMYQLEVEHTIVNQKGEDVKVVASMTTVAPSDVAKFKNLLKGMAAEAKALPPKTSVSKKAWADFYELKRSVVDVGYGYAITVHKVQGSTYDSTYVIESDIMSFPGGLEQRNRMMYTAVSRPRKKLTIFNSAGSTGQISTGATGFGRKFGVRSIIEDKDKGC